MASDVLAVVGGKVRAIRLARRWTLRELAERSGVSVRFLVQLEAGPRAISRSSAWPNWPRPAASPPTRLLRQSDWLPTRREIVALLGLRGAGKTTIGRQLARRLHVRFVELDRRIEKAADMSLAELFSLYGEEHYRRLERETLAARAGGQATDGPRHRRRHRRLPGHVRAAEEAAVTVWLRATPEDHWNRVVQSGRPASDGGSSAGDGGSARPARRARAALRHG